MSGPREGETVTEWKARRRRELQKAAGIEVPSPRVETRPKVPVEQHPVEWPDDDPEVA